MEQENYDCENGRIQTRDLVTISLSGQKNFYFVKLIHVQCASPLDLDQEA